MSFGRLYSRQKDPTIHLSQYCKIWNNVMEHYSLEQSAIGGKMEVAKSMLAAEQTERERESQEMKMRRWKN